MRRVLPSMPRRRGRPRRESPPPGLLGLHCPACGHNENTVLETRRLDGAIRRRRDCDSCNNRWTTYEMGLGVPIDGRRARSLIAAAQKVLEELRNLIPADEKDERDDSE